MASQTGGVRTLHLFEGPSSLDSPAEPSGESRPTVDSTPHFDTHLLALAQLRGVGFHALRALVRAFPNLEKVWWTAPDQVAKVLGDARVPAADQIATAITIEGRQLIAKGERERDRLGQRGYVLIGAHDPAFPDRLRSIPDPPQWLFLEGNPAALTAPPLVAIVGTRKASPLGIEAARQLSRIVLEQGLGVVSGLAEGIDREAHDVAAKHGARQVAVLGTGIEVRFPASNNELRQRIVETGGVVVTEYLPDERYGKANFVQRNRIQAALASAVCPVEASLQSGTRHTLRFAVDLGRPIFGVYREQAAPGNAMVQTLSIDGFPTFDIATETGRAELKRILDRIEGQRATPLEPAGIEFVVKSFEKRARQIASYHNLTDGDRDRIVGAVRKGLAPRAAPAEAHDA